MKLLDVVRRQRGPKPWAEGEKIPWDEPGFSRRMLNVHLSHEHDAASRRFERKLSRRKTLKVLNRGLNDLWPGADHGVRIDSLLDVANL